jgi:hypothetical protein
MVMEFCEIEESDRIELVSEISDGTSSCFDDAKNRGEVGDVGGEKSDGAVLRRGSEGLTEA